MSTLNMSFYGIVIIFNLYVMSFSVPLNETSLIPVKHEQSYESAVIRVKRQDPTVPATDSTSSVSVDPNAVSTETTTTTSTSTTTSYVAVTGTYGFACGTDLYTRYNTRCCALPDMIDRDVIARCNRATNPGSFPMQLSQQNRGKSIPMRKIMVKTSARSGPSKNSSISLSINQICLTQCVFKQLRWLNQFNIVDDTFLFSYLSVQLAGAWYDKLATARIDCDSLFKIDTMATVTNYYGKKCLLLPSKLLRCIKRHFLLNCAQTVNADKQCNLDQITLRSCDISLL